jgi:hypothetical protein
MHLQEKDALLAFQSIDVIVVLYQVHSCWFVETSQAEDLLNLLLCQVFGWLHCFVSSRCVGNAGSISRIGFCDVAKNEYTQGGEKGQVSPRGNARD